MTILYPHSTLVHVTWPQCSTNNCIYYRHFIFRSPSLHQRCQDAQGVGEAIKRHREREHKQAIRPTGKLDRCKFLATEGKSLHLLHEDAPQSRGPKRANVDFSSPMLSPLTWAWNSLSQVWAHMLACFPLPPQVFIAQAENLSNCSREHGDTALLRAQFWSSKGKWLNQLTADWLLTNIPATFFPPWPGRSVGYQDLRFNHI